MRGKPAPNLKDEIQKLAHRMGYYWAENSDPSVPFNGFMYRVPVMIAVKAIKIRYSPGEDCIIEKKFPDDIAEIRTLPLPPWVIREFWVRTQNERAYRRFYILPHTTAEIEENTAENYRNSHYREAYWKKAPYSIDIPLHKDGEKRDEVK
ncbi:MAG: hypothetical protein ABSG49_01895 [Methanoregula sp.]|jgi:hypothetical protein|uniref:hypothetical protein n=1 Tax=Methanoregula sp. TaxID=2052170 RepID=UPI003C138E3B